MSGGVTVGKLLQSRPETLGLDLEILAGSGGLDRRILSPCTLGRIRRAREPCRLFCASGPTQARFIVLTGLSGSGKSQAIRALEDLGYFCVDNIPTTLIPTLADLVRREGISRVAIVVDIREKNFLAEFPKTYRKLREHEGAQSGADLPRSHARHARAPLQRDAAAASAGARFVGVGGHQDRAPADEHASGRWPTTSSTRPT